MTKYPHIMIDQSFHSAAQAVALSNSWEYAYSLGYVSGQYDKFAKRKREHSASEKDDYALGYHRGYSEEL